jgi:hypothetical protein
MEPSAIVLYTPHLTFGNFGNVRYTNDLIFLDKSRTVTFVDRLRVLDNSVPIDRLILLDKSDTVTYICRLILLGILGNVTHIDRQILFENSRIVKHKAGLILVDNFGNVTYTDLVLRRFRNCNVYTSLARYFLGNQEL